MPKLTTKKRKSIPKKSFAEPKERKYPIEDKAHARNALARVSQFGSAEEKKKVRSAVKKKYPGIGTESKSAKSKSAKSTSVKSKSKSR
jgi:hypothetical protein